MNHPTSELNAAQRERRRALVVPREHGAWGILLVPLVTGAAVGLLRGGCIVPVLLLATAVLALFWLRTPLESYLGTSPMRAQSSEERLLVLRVILPLAVIALASLTALFWRGRNSDLLWLGGAAGATFGVQQLLSRTGRATRMAAQMAGALGLTSTAAAAYYVVTGKFDQTAWALWLANWLFAGDQIHFVGLRIRAARVVGWRQKLAAGWSFLAGQIVLAGVLVLAALWRFLPPWTLLAFAPILFRGMAWFVAKPQPIVLRRIGWTELAHAVIFGVLLIAGFSVGRCSRSPVVKGFRQGADYERGRRAKRFSPEVTERGRRFCSMRKMQ